jgi:hypothetical protein
MSGLWSAMPACVSGRPDRLPAADSADRIQAPLKLWLKAAQRPLTDQDDGVTQW